MPTSDFRNINTIIAVITQLMPRRVLDVGCGFGKYGVLLREYLDVWQERLDKSQWRTELVGVEGCGRYRNPIHDYVYSSIHFGDAREVVPTLGRFDVILIADMIEHLEKHDARDLIDKCLAMSPVVVVSTPVDFCPQGELLENPYEKHRCCWRREDFAPGVFVRSIRLVACNVFVASLKPIARGAMALTDPADYVYLRSRMKLGWAGLPLSMALRLLCRALS